jgi:hypothetical protein
MRHTVYILCIFGTVSIGEEPVVLDRSSVDIARFKRCAVETHQNIYVV